MAYALYDVNNNILQYGDLQERSDWYIRGENKEAVFVHRYKSRLNVEINPEKNYNKTAPDLVVNGVFSDLKTQNTPFFTASKYNFNAQDSVTFNLKDALNYQRYLSHSSFLIFFWVDWVAVKMVSDIRTLSVLPCRGVWKIDFSKLNKIRVNSPIHWYNQRVREIESRPTVAADLQEFEPRLREGNNIYSIRSSINGNAACSYVIKLSDLERVI